MKSTLLYIHARSPLHAGTGQGLGGIDLPIAREKATHIPYLPGSSLKGTLRDAYQETVLAKIEKDSPELNKEQREKESQKSVWPIFGPDTNNASDHAGAVQFGDARLLFLPVRSLAGTFALVTSPFLLERYREDALEAGLFEEKSILKGKKSSKILIEDQSKCRTCSGALIAANEQVFLEDLNFTRQNFIPDVLEKATGDSSEKKQTCDPLPIWSKHLHEVLPNLSLEQHLCVVHDDVMSFLLETATEVVARIKLQDATKTVASGGLWYEESLPAESVLYSLVLISSARGQHKMPAEKIGEALEHTSGKLVQLGGKATVGRGLCRLYWSPEIKSETGVVQVPK